MQYKGLIGKRSTVGIRNFQVPEIREKERLEKRSSKKRWQYSLAFRVRTSSKEEGKGEDIQQLNNQIDSNTRSEVLIHMDL